MKLSVTYTVQFNTVIEVENFKQIDDALSDIEIPESPESHGEAGSYYKPNSFEVLKMVDETGENEWLWSSADKVAIIVEDCE